ncbi:O-methyltransferase [Thozetella sp. PMI_491]|nr:O-methyltransferase [Thozetella sp. PMI_491]
MTLSGPYLIHKAEAIVASAKQLGEHDIQARMALMKQVDSLYRDLEPPINSFFSQWTSLTVFTCLDIAVKLGIFEKMTARESISSQELATLVGVDPDVIARVMRILVATGTVASPSEGTYSHTPKSLIYVKGKHTAVDSFELLTLLDVSYITLPEYLKTRTPQDVVDSRKTPYACAYGMEGKTFYEVLSANPDHLDIFNRSMSEPGPNYGIFPFSSLKEEVEAEQDRPFVVDIGGGKGQALIWIRDATKNLFKTSPKLILQERPDVIEQINPKDIVGIDTMVYDFHTEQPVKGALIYYLCQILHNYPDHLCADILSRAAEAMSPQSRLLIVDAVLPDRTEAGADMAGYLIDIVGLAMGGKERTKSELSIMLSNAGLELVKVWQDKTSYQAVVEARLQRG